MKFARWNPTNFSGSFGSYVAEPATVPSSRKLPVSSNLATRSRCVSLPWSRWRATPGSSSSNTRPRERRRSRSSRCACHGVPGGAGGETGAWTAATCDSGSGSVRPEVAFAERCEAIAETREFGVGGILLSDVGVGPTLPPTVRQDPIYRQV